MSIIYKHGYFDYFHLADIGWNLGLYVLGTCRMYGGVRIVPKTYPQICRESRIDKKKYTQWCFSSYSSMMVSILTSWCLNSLVQCSTICCIWTCIQKRAQFIFCGSPMLDNLQLLYMSIARFIFSGLQIFAPPSPKLTWDKHTR